MTTALAERVRARAADVLAERGLDTTAVPAEVTLHRPRRPGLGHYTTNFALRSARHLGVPAPTVAGWLAAGFAGLPDIATAEVAGPGFVNLRLGATAHVAVIHATLTEGAAYGRPRAGEDGEWRTRAGPVELAAPDGGAVTSMTELVDVLGIDTARYAVARARGTFGRTAVDVDLGSLCRWTEDNPAFLVRYAHARAAAVLRNGAELGLRPQAEISATDGATVAVLDHDCPDHGCAGELTRTVGEFPSVVSRAARQGGPRGIAQHLERLAREFLTFYYCRRVSPLDAEQGADGAAPLLALSAAARQVLANGLGLLGVAAPERI